MGAIVGATLTTHVPRLMLPPEKRQAYMGDRVSTFYEAMQRMCEERIKSLEFDTFVIFDSHWGTPTGLAINGHSRHLGCYTSNEIPWMIHDYPYAYFGDPELASLMFEEMASAGLLVYLAKERGLHPEYPTLVTMHYFNPDLIHAVLPLSIPPNASVQNELDYGAAIRRAIEKSNRRVVLVATGGLSHRFLPLDSVPTRASADPQNITSNSNRDYDLQIIEWLKEGMHRNVISLAPEFRAVASPEGGFAHYIRMVSALGGESCTVPGIQYGEYEAALGTGQVILWFDIESHEKEVCQ